MSKNIAKKTVKFVVVRNNRRVSSKEYSSQEDASEEYSYWSNLTSKWDRSAKVDVVEKNEKIHRVY